MNPLALIRNAWNALSVPPANPQRGSYYFPGSNAAGIHVTHEKAFMSAAVWACIDVVSSALASSDWNVYSGVRGADVKTAQPVDNLQYILNTRFNPEMTAQAGKRALAIGAVGYGNGYAEIERDMSRRIVALWPISPDRCEIVRNESGEMVCRVTQDTAGVTIDILMSEVFHVAGPSLVGNSGDDMIAKAIQTIARVIAVDQFAATYFGNNAQLGTVFIHEGQMSADQRADTLKGIQERYSGKKAHTPGLFEGKWTIHQSTNDAEKAQLIDAKNQLIEEVCRWFRVPPHKIAHLLRSTNNNIEHQGLEFSRDTLRPWIKQIEQEADYKLFPARGAQRFVEIDVDWTSEGDFQSRMQGFSTGINSGVYSVNDVRRKLGENTIGDEGNEHLVQGAMMKLEDVGKNMLPQLPEKNPVPGNDVSAAWLESVYARIKRRFENRTKASGLDAAAKDFEVYAKDQLAELGDSLNGLLDRAQQLAVEVAAGDITAKDAAYRVFSKEAA